jgi:hypothetical protein
MAVHKCGLLRRVLDALCYDLGETELAQVRCELDLRTKEVQTLKRRELGILREMRDVENMLAEGLGYLHDPVYGWVIGDHTPATLAMEARRRLQEVS